uniref:Uncharacterized protein n=1 Tax=Podoviridae sp. ctKS020 TaxID=2826552 RepID=A0A8S5QST6_9CAUD|nr:MAG TPA: hypothetical protein [Podoviridae sp. ctKS020]
MIFFIVFNSFFGAFSSSLHLLLYYALRSLSSPFSKKLIIFMCFFRG